MTRIQVGLGPATTAEFMKDNCWGFSLFRKRRREEDCRNHDSVLCYERRKKREILMDFSCVSGLLGSFSLLLINSRR